MEAGFNEASKIIGPPIDLHGTFRGSVNVQNVYGCRKNTIQELKAFRETGNERNLDNAYYFANRALTLVDEKPELAGELAHCLTNLGSVYFADDDIEMAHELALQALNEEPENEHALSLVRRCSKHLAAQPSPEGSQFNSIVAHCNAQSGGPGFGHIH